MPDGCTLCPKMCLVSLSWHVCQPTFFFTVPKCMKKYIFTSWCTFAVHKSLLCVCTRQKKLHPGIQTTTKYYKIRLKTKIYMFVGNGFLVYLYHILRSLACKIMWQITILTSSIFAKLLMYKLTTIIVAASEIRTSKSTL